MRRVLTSLVKTTPARMVLTLALVNRISSFEYASEETHSMTVRLEEIDDEDAIVEDRNVN